MKKFIIPIILVAFVLVSIVVVFLYTHCNKYSGWTMPSGGSSKCERIKLCEEAKTGNYYDDPNMVDEERYEFKCVMDLIN